MNLIEKSELPTISIVTPNYNYGSYIERTIDSILSQGYPKLNYIVIDGGSTDCSKKVIEKYEHHLSFWQSKPDNGQADAINIGLRHAEGAIFNWINSDDVLAPGSLSVIAETHQESRNSLIAGNVLNVPTSTQDDPELVIQSGLDIETLLSGNGVFHQPGLWWILENIKSLGPLDTSLDFCFDYLLLLRYLVRWPKVVYTSHTLANFTIHSSSKTTTSQVAFDEERIRILSLLLQDGAFSDYKSEINRKILIHDWYQSVDTIRNRDSSPKLIRLSQIILLAAQSPSIRFSRFTAGALVRLLLP
jgi:glycosyltransferase involved in cell wall biosynthesis